MTHTAYRIAARFVTAAGNRFVIGPGGLEEPGGSGINLQKGAMYGLGASSSPTRVVLTDVTDEKVKYVEGPYFQGSARTMEAWIARDLLEKGTRTLLKAYGKYMDPKLRSSMESLLKGGKGRVEKLNDYKPIKVDAVATDPNKDEWRTAEQYGSVGGREETIQGKEVMVYEIDSTQGELADIKRDKRLKVLKVSPRKA